MASENEAQLIVTLTWVRNPMTVTNAAADRCRTYLARTALETVRED